MWLNYVGQPWKFVHFFYEQGQFLGKNVGFGEEVEVAHAVSDLHLRDAFVHQVFSGEMEGVGEVVDFLVGQERAVYFWIYYG